MPTITKKYILYAGNGLKVNKRATVERLPEKKDVITAKEAEILVFDVNLIHIVKDVRTEFYDLTDANLLLTILDRYLGGHITTKVHFNLRGDHFSASKKKKGTDNLCLCCENSLPPIETILTPEDAANFKYCIYHVLRYIADAG